MNLEKAIEKAVYYEKIYVDRLRKHEKLTAVPYFSQKEVDENLQEIEFYHLKLSRVLDLICVFTGVNLG